MGATTTIRRRLDWTDTDAAGYWHYSAFFRFAEAAEAQLHRDLGISDRTFGHTPRVRVEADYRTPVFFDEEVAVTLTVAEVGRTAVTYEVTAVRREDLIATGKLVTVFIDGAGSAAPWPDDIAAALRGETAG